MGLFGGGDAPDPPDPFQTAAAEAQFNRLDTFNPGGGGIRHGYTVPAGTAPDIEVVTSFSQTNNRPPGFFGGENAAGGGGGGWFGQPVQSFKVGDRTFDSRDAAEAYRGTLETGETRFVEGVAPPGFQSAQRVIESPTERALRQLMEPASISLTQQLVNDNINNLPDRAEVRDRSDVADSLYGRAYGLIEPSIKEEERRLLSNLQARGMPVGSEGFNDAYGDMTRETQDTLSRLAMDATLQAGQEQSRQYQLDGAERREAIGELATVLGGGLAPPNNGPTGQAQPINFSGLVGQQYQAELQQYQADQQRRASTFSTIGSIAGGLLLKSSRTFKEVYPALDASDAAEIVARVPVHVWRYSEEHGGGDVHVGPIAEDWHNVTGLGDGKTIHMGDAIGVLMAALQDAMARIEKLEQVMSGAGHA